MIVTSISINGAIELKEWLAIHAAVLSTTVAVVQFRSAWRTRPRLRVQLWEIETRTHERDYHSVGVTVANRGETAVRVYAPTLEIARHSRETSEIYRTGPDDVSVNHECGWVPFEFPESSQSYELGYTESETYRAHLTRADRILAVEIVDGAGGLRYRYQPPFARAHRICFYCKHLVWRLRRLFAPTKSSKRDRRAA